MLGGTRRVYFAVTAPDPTPPQRVDTPSPPLPAKVDAALMRRRDSKRPLVLEQLQGRGPRRAGPGESNSSRPAPAGGHLQSLARPGAAADSAEGEGRGKGA